MRGRARNRAEAQQRARTRTKKKPGERVPQPPSWSSALKKGGVAAALFVALLTLFGQSPVASLLIGVLMMGFYVPMVFLMDRFLHQRHLRKEEQRRAEREAERGGARESEG